MRVPESWCLACGDKSMGNVVIPVAMQTFPNIVVVKSILKIEPGKILVQGIVRPDYYQPRMRFGTVKQIESTVFPATT